MKNQKKTFLVFIVLFSISYIFLVACFGIEKKNKNINNASQKIASQNQKKTKNKTNHDQKQILNLGISLPVDFNPFTNKNKSMDKILKLIFEPLVKFDKNNMPINNLASQIIFDKDNSVNIKLREDIYLSDGSKLNSDDLIFSIYQIKFSPKGSIYNLLKENIISYQKLSEYEIKINFKEASFISIFLLDFPVVPYKNFSDLNLDFDFDSDNNQIQNINNFICSGPYKIKEYKRQKHLLLEANQNYFNSKPYFKNISIIITPDQATNIYAFNQNIIDLVSSDINNLAKFKNNTSKIFYNTGQIEFIYFNPNNNLFNIKPLLNSIINILPIDQIKTEIYSNYLAQSLLDTKIKPIDIKQSEKIIKYNISSNQQIKILVNQENPQRIKAATLIKKIFDNYNLETIVIKKDFAAYNKDIKNKSFDILISGFMPKQKFNYQKLLGPKNLLSYENNLIQQDLININSAVNHKDFFSSLENLSSDLSQDSKIIILGQTKKILLVNKNKFIHTKESSFINNFLDIN